MKKILIPLIITIVFILTFMVALPIYADQPDTPGQMSKVIKEQNLEGYGRAYYVQLTLDYARENDTNLGQLLKGFLNDVCGIPPKHTP